ncbi:MAG TPA: aminotransferase class V-fold PLP-dependent enzyme [Steroidobacteraceae bacterium]|nr:aminotransferase class V-fold PLP-dependent enzyme [Steroidobacteraceae bacterium]
MSHAPLYLDYAATTPVDPLVAQAMSECLTAGGDFGNPSSAHDYGKQAAARIEHARVQVAALLGAQPQEIVFTSGATESNNLAILGGARANAHRGRHLVSVRTEHKSVLDTFRRLEKEGFSVTWLTPTRSGRLDPEAFAAALRADTILASVMHVNNETGVIEDVATLGALCAERGIAFHSDCAQAAGKVAVDFGRLPLDFASVTAHKLYGPKGIGALYVRSGARGSLQPLLHGGGQERGLRPGTLPTHQIVGFGTACELAVRELPAEGARLTRLREKLWRGLAALGGMHLNGAAAPRVPGILNVSFEGVQGESLVAALSALALSTGSACSSDSPEPSYVLRALGRPAQLAQSSLRFSFGRFTADADIERAVSSVAHELAPLRALSPDAATARTPGRWTIGGHAAGAAVVSGEGGGPGQDTWVRFQLLVADGTVKDARFQAYACPHTTNVAAWLCGQLPGRARAALIPGSPAEWAAARGIPVEKLGRLLIVEDALRACLSQWV